MRNLAHAITRAAARVPGPVAERSVAAVTAWRTRTVADVRIPAPQPTTRLLRIAPGEMWCARCAETVAGDHCMRCGSNRFYPATLVLRPDEYYIAT